MILRPLLLALAATGAVLLAPAARAANGMVTDRPDSTESPFAVAPGRVQLEMSFAEFARDSRNPERASVRATGWGLASTNVRVGVAPGLELGVVLAPWQRVTVRAGGVTGRVSGFGDMLVRLKAELVRRDDGWSAALFPYVKVPTARSGLGNGRWEGGVILPVARDLGDGWGFGAMTEVALVRRAERSGYTAAWFNTATLSRDLAENLGAFVELTSLAGGEGAHALTGNTGLTWAATPDLQFDAGINLGLTRAADDLVLFAGVSRRF